MYHTCKKIYHNGCITQWNSYHSGKILVIYLWGPALQYVEFYGLKQDIKEKWGTDSPASICADYDINLGYQFQL